MLNEAFRPAKINQMDPFVEETAYKLIDAFIENGHCDWVKQYAVPLPLIVIGRQMGVPEDDIWRIKAWTDAWVRRLGLMQTEEEEQWSVEMEIEAQHYFQPRFERLRKQPDDTLLSELVNRVIPEQPATAVERILSTIDDAHDTRLKAALDAVITTSNFEAVAVICSKDGNNLLGKT